MDEASPDEPVLILLSSGTTGAPSGAVLSRANLEHRIRAGASEAFPGQGQRYMSCLPLCFSMGFTMVLRSVHYGHPVFIHPPLFTAQELVSAVRNFEATYMGIVPAILASLLHLEDREIEVLSGLQAIRISGSAVAPDVKVAARARIHSSLYFGYGAAACGTVCEWLRDDPELPSNCVGRPHKWVEWKICDPEGRGVPPDQPGMLWVRSPGLAAGLLTMDGQYESLHDRWYSPGDLVRVDDCGRLHVVGRATDVIVRDGINIYPELVENALRLHPYVRDVAVVGRAASTADEEVIAYVVAEGAVGLQELLAHCRRHLATKYLPSEIRFVSQLPRTVAGKIKRREVHCLLGSGDPIPSR